MHTWGLCLARWSAAAWVGAALLFVAVGVREVTHPSFTSEIKDELAALRFPLYYACGTVLVTCSWIGSWLAKGHPQLPGHIRRVVLVLLTLALVVMALDYLWIYRPLEALVTPPGKVRTEHFLTLHRWSMRVNTLQVLLCLLAGIALCWPGYVPSDK